MAEISEVASKKLSKLTTPLLSMTNDQATQWIEDLRARRAHPQAPLKVRASKMPKPVKV
jgi:hypothetical protein